MGSLCLCPGFWGGSVTALTNKNMEEGSFGILELIFKEYLQLQLLAFWESRYAGRREPLAVTWRGQCEGKVRPLAMAPLTPPQPALTCQPREWAVSGAAATGPVKRLWRQKSKGESPLCLLMLQDYEQIKDSFRFQPLNLGMVCYTAIDNLH